MNPAVAKLAQLVRDETGNVLAAERLGLLEEVGARRAALRGQATLVAYTTALADGRLDGEWEALIAAITIKESYFFRAPQQFEAIQRQIIPGVLRARAAERRLRVWSAACARGEEPATLAMVLAETPALAGWDWRILATDLDGEALAIAERGLYSERAIAQVPPALAARYLRKNGKLHELDPRLQERIEYRRLNLAQPPYALPDPKYDLILLRNVLIYFRRPLQRKVLRQVGSALAPDGTILLGASETLWQIQDELEAVDLGGCFAYRPSRTAGGAATPRPAGLPGQKTPTPDATARRRSGTRSGPVTLTVPPPPPASRTAAKPPSPRILANPTADAPATIPTAAHAPSADSGRPLRELVRSAAVDLAKNRLPEAERALAEALERSPGDVASHTLLGFLHDVAGRPDEAIAAYRAALYLDPSLFQPRLLLADCLRRMGIRDRAERSYREVLATLEAGGERVVEELAGLPVPDREGALRRCRDGLRRGSI